ncbi:MAG: glycosyltransferase family 4 protein [Hyphomonadaceae bacterium]|nr:glycosyltransferase family 4 protein [Hyphomonadaceae bacterium]
MKPRAHASVLARYPGMCVTPSLQMVFKGEKPRPVLAPVGPAPKIANSCQHPSRGNCAMAAIGRHLQRSVPCNNESNDPCRSAQAMHRRSRKAKSLGCLGARLATIIPFMSKHSTPRGAAFRKAWRAIVPPSLLKYGQPAAIALGLRHLKAALAHGEPTPTPGPLIVSGLLAGRKGVSRAAHLTIEGFRVAGHSPVAHDLSPLFNSNSEQVGRLPVLQPGGVWLLHVNAPEAIAAMSRIKSPDWLGRYRIAYWAYELPRAPAMWVAASAVFHEIWAPSRFVSEALIAAGVQTPVRVMPHPVTLARRPAVDHASGDEFIVLAMGDLTSSATRKNLIGAIKIYKRAFPQETHGTRLILKVQSDDHDPKFREAALAVAGGRQDIVFRTGSLSDAEIDQLIAAATVLLSPHRSEGFGLAIAEAFLAGVPSLATGWSGNMDFMETLPELLIAHTQVPVRDPGRIYRAADLNWAEPDVDDAAQKLRALAASPTLRRELARRGKACLQVQAEMWSRDALASMPIGRLLDDA